MTIELSSKEALTLLAALGDYTRTLTADTTQAASVRALMLADALNVEAKLRIVAAL